MNNGIIGNGEGQYKTVGHYVAANKAEIAEKLGVDKDTPLWGENGLVNKYTNQAMGKDVYKDESIFKSMGSGSEIPGIDKAEEVTKAADLANIDKNSYEKFYNKIINLDGKNSLFENLLSRSTNLGDNEEKFGGATELDDYDTNYNDPYSLFNNLPKTKAANKTANEPVSETPVKNKTAKAATTAAPTVANKTVNEPVSETPVKNKTAKAATTAASTAANKTVNEPVSKTPTTNNTARTAAAKPATSNNTANKAASKSGNALEHILANFDKIDGVDVHNEQYGKVGTMKDGHISFKEMQAYLEKDHPELSKDMRNQVAAAGLALYHAGRESGQAGKINIGTNKAQLQEAAKKLDKELKGREFVNPDIINELIEKGDIVGTNDVWRSEYGARVDKYAKTRMDNSI